MCNENILHAIFGSTLPTLSMRERGVAERVLNWLREYPNTIDNRNSPAVVQSVVNAANKTLTTLYGLDISQLRTKGRKRPFVDYRRWTMLAMDEESTLTQGEIAKIMGRNRTSIPNAKIAVADLCAYNRPYREEYQKFTNLFTSNLLCENIPSSSPTPSGQ